MTKHLLVKASLSSQLANFNAKYEHLMPSASETPQGDLMQHSLPFPEINPQDRSRALISPLQASSALNKHTQSIGTQSHKNRGNLAPRTVTT